MDKRISDIALALSVSLLVHVLILGSSRLFPGSPPRVEQASISVELSSPASRVPQRQAARETIPPPHIEPGPKSILAQPESIPVEHTPSVTQPKSSIPPAQSPTIYASSRLTRAPRFRHRVEVVYPASERAGGTEAQVLAEAVIDTGGRVVDVAVIESAGPNFDAAVVAALRQSTFLPGYLDSLPVMTRVQIPFRFKLK